MDDFFEYISPSRSTTTGRVSCKDENKSNTPKRGYVPGIKLPDYVKPKPPFYDPVRCYLKGLEDAAKLCDSFAVRNNYCEYKWAGERCAEIIRRYKDEIQPKQP